ncbi:MAG: hypothetical protein K0Q90_1988 [Paenibacillaceae bacterium]|jgi:hypothetical protein|nr:hypothetical protein [Paenibacillaceae bacterium]
MKQILVFLLFSLMLVWLMFSPVYRHILILRQAMLQKETDYLLEVGASGTFGYIDEEMLEASRERLVQVGFNRDQLVYTVTAQSGLDPMDADRPLFRGDGIRLVVTYPYGNLFGVDRLLGISSPGSTDRMGAAGMKMSEYVP